MYDVLGFEQSDNVIKFSKTQTMSTLLCVCVCVKREWKKGGRGTRRGHCFQSIKSAYLLIISTSVLCVCSSSGVFVFHLEKGMPSSSFVYFLALLAPHFLLSQTPNTHNTCPLRLFISFFPPGYIVIKICYVVVVVIRSCFLSHSFILLAFVLALFAPTEHKKITNEKL